MKSKGLRILNDWELSKKLESFREELFKLRFQHATGQLEKTAKIPYVKQSIARALTILKERQEKESSL